MIRPATLADLESITMLTRDRRNQLAGWEPLYWNPRDGIEETHPLFLRWCIEHNDNCDVVVAVENDVVIGCIFINRRPDHVFLDDFCVVDQRWSEIGSALTAARTDKMHLICAPTNDHAQNIWLESSEFEWVSTFFSLRIPELDRSDADPEPMPLPGRLDDAPAHVFGHFDANTANGLQVCTGDGYAIGSAPVFPAAYDPGGPTTVIDRVQGPNRLAVVEAALRSTSRRGDVHVIFVVDHSDHELTEVLIAAGATQPVNLWRCMPATCDR